MSDARLTPRESEILALVKKGWTNKAIADRLGVTINTVKAHVHNMYGKLGLQTKRPIAPPRTRIERRKILAPPDKLETYFPGKP